MGIPQIEVTSIDEMIYSAGMDNCSFESAQWKITDTKTITHTVKVEGSGTATLKGGLLTGLVVKSEAKVTVGGGYEGSSEETVSISIEKTMPSCTRHYFTQKKTKKIATGRQSGCEEAWWDNNSHTGECNSLSNTGSSTGWSGESGSFTQPGSCSGSPCVPATRS
jgi:hypothetical protein